MTPTPSCGWRDALDVLLFWGARWGWQLLGYAIVTLTLSLYLALVAWSVTVLVLRWNLLGAG
jgi:hypothetical protein